MKQLTPDDLISIRDLSINDLVKWVEAHGWKRIAHPNEKVFVFVEPLASVEPPLKIFIPHHLQYLDAYQRIAEVVQLLANYYDRSPQAIIQEINQQHRYRLRQLPSNAAKATKQPTAKARRNKSQSARNPKP